MAILCGIRATALAISTVVAAFMGGVEDNPSSWDRRQKYADVLKEKAFKGAFKLLDLGMVLMSDPKLIMLDEPTDGLDPTQRDAMLDLIRRIGNEFGISVVLSSHLLADVEDVCDRVAILNKGRLVAEGNLGNLLSTSIREIEVVMSGLPGEFVAHYNRYASRVIESEYETLLAVADEELANQIVRDGHRFDVGPSLFLMPQVFRETYAALGERMEDHLDLVRDHEHRVETDAELPDQVGQRRVGRALVLQLLQKVRRAGLGNRAQVFDQLVAVHTDAVVGDRQGPLLPINREPDGQLALVLIEALVGECLEAQLLSRIGGVGDKFTQENLLVGIERANNEIENAGNLGLERLGFLVSYDRHICWTPVLCRWLDSKTDQRCEMGPPHPFFKTPGVVFAARSADGGEDFLEGFLRIGRARDRAADDKVGGAGIERIARRHDTPLVARITAGRAHAGRNKLEIRPEFTADTRCLARRADDAVQAALFGETREPADVVLGCAGIADLGDIVAAEAGEDGHADQQAHAGGHERARKQYTEPDGALPDELLVKEITSDSKRPEREREHAEDRAGEVVLDVAVHPLHHGDDRDEERDADDHADQQPSDESPLDDDEHDGEQR